jgi:hypothetical protein
MWIQCSGLTHHQNGVKGGLVREGHHAVTEKNQQRHGAVVQQVEREETVVQRVREAEVALGRSGGRGGGSMGVANH